MKLSVDGEPGPDRTAVPAPQDGVPPLSTPGIILITLLLKIGFEFHQNIFLYKF